MRMLLFTAMLLCSSPVSAGQWSANYHNIGVGAVSCDKWPADDGLAKPAIAWISGFFTALNYVTALGKDDIGKTLDIYGIIDEVGKECQAHPAEILSEATMSVYIRLSKQVQ